MEMGEKNVTLKTLEQICDPLKCEISSSTCLAVTGSGGGFATTRHPRQPFGCACLRPSSARRKC
jgi:hypothetical protein